MSKYVGTHVVKDNVELEKLLKEGYSHITEQGYALSDDEDISTDDISIVYALCWLYDSMEENNIDLHQLTIYNKYIKYIKYIK